MKIYLTAIVKSKPEHIVEVLQVLENMVTETRKESACLLYDLHQGIEDKNLFVFYEIWESQHGLDLHNEQPYIKEFKSLAEGKLAEEPLVCLLQKIEK